MLIMNIVSKDARPTFKSLVKPLKHLRTLFGQATNLSYTFIPLGLHHQS